jgi:hypothetical protein
MARDPKNLRIHPTHCRAICDEIGERLRESLGRESTDMPPYLRRLVDRLDELDLDNVSSPGIVPLIEDPLDSTISAVLEPA